MIRSNYQTLEEAFLYFADCQAATYEHLSMLKGTTKSNLNRQHSICTKMLDAAIRFGLDKDSVAEIHERVVEADNYRSSQLSL